MLCRGVCWVVRRAAYWYCARALNVCLPRQTSLLFPEAIWGEYIWIHWNAQLGVLSLFLLYYRSITFLWVPLLKFSCSFYCNFYFIFVFITEATPFKKKEFPRIFILSFQQLCANLSSPYNSFSSDQYHLKKDIFKCFTNWVDHSLSHHCCIYIISYNWTDPTEPRTYWETKFASNLHK